METEQKYSLWVDHHHRIISFKFMEEYAHLTFPSMDKLMDYARKLSRTGYRIQ